MAAASSSPGKPEHPFADVTPFASSTTTLCQQPFDVFINHRGPDVKLNLASPIYHVLDLLRVKAFLDKEELDLGDFIPQALKDAIGSALIHIAIFSPTYAESAWCLAELSLMVETGAPIIPIFYDVEPAHLKWGVTKGLYAKVFEEHETKGRYKRETLDKWKRALHKVSEYTGCVVTSTGDLGILLKEVANRVLQEIKNVKVPFKVADYLVGLDYAVKGFEDAIDPSARVKIVGIVGMAGCGKTTLARELYNRKFKGYDKCSFLSDVREAALPELQKKLLEDLLHLRDIPFRDEEEGLSILGGRLKSSSPRVLIVLDDIDKVGQLDALLPDNGKSLRSDSLVIVTTGNSVVLTKWGISSIYKMPEMSELNAKKLFCSHAFSKTSPPKTFEGLVQEFVNACNGLPLSLKVIARMLIGKTKKQWESELEKISRVLPGEIKERLRLSYDALDKEEKNIFLDVACFFVGEKKSLAIAVWDAAKWSDLENLVSKCLVEIDNQNRVRMHHHLRDLGREIALDCSPYRLWKDQQIERYTQPRISIRGIMAATTQFVRCSAHNEFPKCSGLYPPPYEECMDLKCLEVLVVAKNYFSSEFARLSKALVWLRWFDLQHTNLPPWLSLTNLRVLELYGAPSLRELWENNGQPPKELREMIITATEGNSFHSFPSQISGLEHLTKIALISCHGKEFLFTKLPEDFCNLPSLKHLELRYCKKLSKLPKHFGKLKALRYLDLCFCQDLRSLPDSFNQLIDLTYLDLSGCEKLSPVDIPENMDKLENLYFSGHSKLEELPVKIVEQKSLRDLRLDKTALMDIPSNIDQLSKLETLVIGSPHLTGFPESLGYLSSLTRLKITGCKKLESLPQSVDRLNLLEYLCIKFSGVKSLPQGFRQLTNLQYLKIIDCPITDLNFGSGSSSLCKLKAIYLKGIHVTSLSISQDCCTSLETLELEQNYRLKEMDIYPKSLKMVIVDECTLLSNINNIQDLNREILKITRCPEFRPQSTEQFSCLRKRKRHEVSDTSESGRDVKFRIPPGHSGGVSP